MKKKKQRQRDFCHNIWTYFKGQTYFFTLGYDIVSDKSNLLVDCRATEYVITDKSKFINFEQNFEPGNYFVELADRSQVNNNITIAKDACVDVILKNAFHIPTFKQNIFSVCAAKKKKNGVHISFECDNCQLIYTNGAVFKITQRGHLYYLKNIVSAWNATYDLTYLA